METQVQIEAIALGRIARAARRAKEDNLTKIALYFFAITGVGAWLFWLALALVCLVALVKRLVIRLAQLQALANYLASIRPEGRQAVIAAEAFLRKTRQV